MMKHFALKFSAALLAILPVAKALAADLPPPPPPPPPIHHVIYDWSGAYGGLWVGTACINGTLVDNGSGSPWLNAGCGFKGGALLGYNIQTGNTVIGAEIDAGRTTTLATNNDPGANFTFGLDYLVTARARVGYAIDDNLVYLTGGGAWAQGNINATAPFTTPSNLTAQEFGWVVGAGFEHAFSDRFRMRLGYEYTHMMDTNYQQGCCNVTVKWGDEHEVKLAAIWAF